MGARTRHIKKPARKATPPSTLWWLALPAVLGFLLYLPALGHHWCLDDYSVIVDNWVTRKGWEGIPLHLTHHYRWGYWGGEGELYRPLSLIMFAAEWALVGDKPWLGHLVNTGLYAMVCFLFGYGLYRWTGNRYTVLVAALLFAAHPVHTEVVANIKSRDELLAAFFLLLAWECWRRSLEGKRRALALAGAATSFFLALLSKESAITFLPLFPLSPWAFRGRAERKMLLQSAVLLIPAVAFLLLRQIVLGDVKAIDAISVVDNVLAGAPDSATALATAIRHIGEYMRMLIWPWPLVSDKGWNQIPLTGWGAPGVWGSLLVLLLLLAVAIRFRHTRRELVFGLLWMGATFSLAANLFFLIGTSYGERLLFLPSAGFALAVAFLLTGGRDLQPGAWRRHPVTWGVLVAVGLGSLLTIWRLPAWKDSHTLYRTDIVRSPESVKLRYHYALETGKAAAELPQGPERQALLQEALQDLDTVTRRHPVYWEAFSTAGLYAYRLGDRERAMASYEQATSLNPGAAIAWSNMGIIYAERGQLDKALEVYRKATEADPRFVDAWTNLGAILAQTGQFEEAIAAFREAMTYEPDNIRVLKMLGAAWRDSGRPEEGQPYLDKAARLERSHR